MKSLKIGIFGCGKQAAKHIASLKKIGNITIVVTDKDRELAKAFAEQEHCGYAAQAQDILADSEVQAVIICTPTLFHVGLIRQALGAHKHVFCEKPLAESEAEMAALQQVAANTSRILMVGYIYRFVPVFEECHRLFQKQAIDGESMVMGRPLTAFFRLGGRGAHQVWKHKKDQGGGSINEMLVHMLDLANWFFGPLRDIQVISNRLLLKERTIQGQPVEADAEDYTLVLGSGQYGVQIFCQADLVTPDFCQYVEIQSENGSFRGSIQAEQQSYVFLKESRGGYDAGRTQLSFGKRNLLDIQMASFIQTVLSKASPDRNTLEDSMELIKIVEQVKGQVRGQN